MSVEVPLPTFPAPFGRFVLLDRLAVGGMAEIFKAKMTGAAGFEKIIVIKRILPHLAEDRQFVDMFIDEAKLTVHLVHPKIVQVLEFGEVDGQYYIALEYVEGLDCLALLRACAHKRVRLPPTLAAHIGLEVLDALDYAHRATDPEGRALGIVHRDISPSNVFIARRGDVKLGDFGIAHASERQSKTQAGTLKGKYGYMSPEQVVGGKLDGRSDIFAVGIVLAEMLMGRRLFTAPNDLDVLLMVRDVKLERLEKYGNDVPGPLREIVMRSLRRHPAERFTTAGHFRDALADWLFTHGTRISASDVGSFLRSLYVEGTADSEVPMVRQGTIAGHSTRAAAVQADLIAESARRELERVRSNPSVPVLRPGAQPGSAAPSGPPELVPRRAVRPPPPLPASMRRAGPEPLGPAARGRQDGGRAAPIEGPPSGLSRPPSGLTNPPSGLSRPPSGITNPPSGLSRPPSGVSQAPRQARGPTDWGLSKSGSTRRPAGLDEDRPSSGSLPAVTPSQILDGALPLEDDGLELNLDAEKDDLDGLDIDIELTPTPTPTSSANVDETTPASLAEAFQVLESTPNPLEELVTTGRYDIADQIDRAFEGLSGGSGDATPTEVGPLVDPASVVSRGGRITYGEAHVTPPDEQGDLAEVSISRIFTRLAVCRETGMLRVECGGAVKDIYLVEGAPEYVTSNLARELLGEYLVAQGVITSGELSMALAMMPRFSGKLGDTLVGLSLMRPLDVFRHLTRQVRDKLVDVFTWARGQWRYWRGRTNQREAFPLGIDPFEIVGAGVLAIPVDYLEARFRPLGELRPRARPGVLVEPDAFRVGPMPHELLNRLDGSRSIAQWIRMYTNEQELGAFLRTLYLLVEADLASLE
jgi:serine/threonine protein kinase